MWGARSERGMWNKALDCMFHVGKMFHDKGVDQLALAVCVWPELARKGMTGKTGKQKQNNNYNKGVFSK